MYILSNYRRRKKKIIKKYAKVYILPHLHLSKSHNNFNAKSAEL